MTENEARNFISSGLAWIQSGTTLTNTPIDDNVVQMALAAVNSDILWPWIWTLIDDLMSDSPLVSGSSTAEMEAAADKAGIDPLTIIAIVTAIVDLWRKFRK